MLLSGMGDRDHPTSCNQPPVLLNGKILTPVLLDPEQRIKIVEAITKMCAQEAKVLHMRNEDSLTQTMRMQQWVTVEERSYSHKVKRLVNTAVEQYRSYYRLIKASEHSIDAMGDVVDGRDSFVDKKESFGQSWRRY
jgi:hypothetical protein